MRFKWFSFFVIAAAAALISCGGKDSVTTVNQQPVITAVIPSQAVAGQQNVAGTIQGRNLSATVHVNLGDGVQVSNVQNTSESEIRTVFSVNPNAAPGMRIIAVTTASGTASMPGIFHILPANSKLVAHFHAPAAATSGKAVEFDGRASTDKGGHIVSYHWQFGDGKSAQGKVVRHRYLDSKRYIVSLSVTDNHQARDSVNKQIRIVPAGSCDANAFRANEFSVLSVSGNRISASAEIRDCPRLCGEIRRKARGINEFVGNVIRFNGNVITFNPVHLPTSTRPRAGEHLFLVWKNCRRR